MLPVYDVNIPMIYDATIIIDHRKHDINHPYSMNESRPCLLILSFIKHRIVYI